METTQILKNENTEIPTAKEFAINCIKAGCTFEESLIMFAQLHTKKALETAAKKAKCTQDYLPDDSPPFYYVEENSILEAYPKEFII